jgi:uncharacterized protein
MPVSWPEATVGPLGAGIGILLTGWFVLVEPLLGRQEARGLQTARRDAGALLAFYRRTVASLLAAGAVVLVLVAVDRGVDAAAVGLAVPELDGPVAGLLVGALAGMVVATLGGWRSPAPVPPRIALLLPRTARERRWAGAVAVAAGVGEELVFRGALPMLGIGLLGLAPLVAFALSTLIFGLAHLYQGVAGIVATTALGAVLAALTVLTQSLLPAIVLHVLVDVRALLLTRPG